MTNTVAIRITDVGSNRRSLREYLVEHHELTDEEAETLLDEVEGDRGALLETDVSQEEAENIQNELEERGGTVELDPMFSVFGTVRTTDDAPASGVTIRVLQQGDIDEEVGANQTDNDGKCEIRYIAPPEIDDISLVVRAFHPESEDELAESEPIESPRETEEVNLIVDLPATNSGATTEEPIPSLGNDVFRFAVVRPPEPTLHSGIILDTVTNKSRLRETLIARKTEDDRAGMIKEARLFVDSRSFVSDEEDLSISVFDLDARLSNLDSSATETEYRTIIEEVTGQQPEDLIERDDYLDDFQELGDSLLAATLVPGRSSDTSRLARSIQIYSLIQHLATESQSFEDGDRISDILERDIGLPDGLFPLPRPSSDAKEGSKTSEQSAGQSESSLTGKATTEDAKELRQRLARLREAREELTFAEFTDVTDEPTASLETDGSGQPSEFQQGSPSLHSPSEVNGGGFVSNFLTGADRVITAARWVVDGSQTGYSESRVSVADEVPIDSNDEEDLSNIQRTKVLSANAIDDLSAETVETIDSFGLEIDSTDVSRLFDRIEREEKKTERQLLKIAPMDVSVPTVSLGGQILPATEIQQMLSNAAGIETSNGKDDQFMDLGDSSKVIRDLLRRRGLFEDARIKPIGCMDLEVVRQETKRYELGEVAHIENVLKSETKDRTHRRKRTTDETTIFESETTEETEQDLQSTERFELQREAEEVIKEESRRDSNSSIETDTTVKASYGPTLEVNAGFGYSSQSSSAQQNARENTVRTASDYSRSVTERAVNRVQNRVREEQIRRVIEEIEETNAHGFVNTGTGADHISGIYRWVDKVYRNQLINYGVPRMMFEFIVPEPAFFYLWAQSNPTDTIQKPLPPQELDSKDPEPLRPEHFNEENYQRYAQMYDAADISPPPQLYRLISEEVEEKRYTTPSDAKPKYYTKSIKIEEGYTPIKARATAVNIRYWEIYSSGYTLPRRDGEPVTIVGGGERLWPNNGHDLLVLKFGGATFLFEHPTTVGVVVKDIGFPVEESPVETGGAELPITVFAERLKGFAAGIEILCERTERAYQQWQIDTYNAIMDGYRNQLSKYEEEVAAAEVTGISIAGNNPNENRRTERDELKRSILTILSNDRLDFDAIDDESTSTQPIPDIDLAAAEEQQDLIHFLENAFEWEHMNYVFYSYYWGRRNTWVDKLNLDDPDPLFAQFLKAGAARVLVPVRHDEENRWAEDLAYYLTWNEPYKGQGRPPYGDPQYVDIINDIKNRQGVAKEGGTVEDEWDITLPTSLVKLQADGTLPVFIPESEGELTIVNPEVNE